MAKNFLSLLMSRKTTYEFGDKRVSETNVKKILEAARWSPSFLNLQPWEFIIVRDQKQICRLLENAYYGIYSCNDHPGVPPVIAAIVLKKKCWEGQYAYPNRDKPGIFEAYLSVAMPAMNMTLQAEELGIASTILNVDAYAAAKLLKLSGGDSVPLIVCLGYEKQGAKKKKRSRKPLANLVHYEQHGGHKV